MTDTVFLQQAVNAISLGAIYVLFSLGYALVFSILGVLNLAHSAIFMWGAFIGLLALESSGVPYLIGYTLATVPFLLAFAFNQWQLDDRIRRIEPEIARQVVEVVRTVGLGVICFIIADWIFKAVTGYLVEQPPLIISPLVALLLAMVGAGCLSVVLEFIAFRPLRARNAARIAQLISSIGAALLLVNIAQLMFQQVYNRTEAYFPRDIAILPFISNETIIIEMTNGDIRIAPIRIVILVIAILLMVFLQYLVTRTRTGQQMRAVAFNQRIAGLLGIDVGRVFVLTFFLAGAFGGAAGMLYGLAFLNVTPFIGDDIALVGLTAIVLGGMGSIQGAVLGGFIVAILQTGSTALGGSSYRDAVVFILLFLVLLVRPQGLLGQPEQTRA